MPKQNEHARVYHFDLYGKRNEKYEFLKENTLDSIRWNELENRKPEYFFVKKDWEEEIDYCKGFRLDKLFEKYASGIKTHDDKNLISNKKFNENNNKYFYRPFDVQFINYDLNKVKRHRFSLMKHLMVNNIAILIPRQAITYRFGFFISKGLTDINYTGTAGQFGAGLTFPLYLYPEDNGQQTLEQATTPAPPAEGNRKPNLNMEIVSKIAGKIGAGFVPEKFPSGGGVASAARRGGVSDSSTRGVAEGSRHVGTGRGGVSYSNGGDNGEVLAPIDILDYIYAVLHSPAYREKYKEFLKIDFPRVPYPKNADTFWKLVKIGGELRQIHLLESPAVENYITQYPVDGDNTVEKPVYEQGASAPCTPHTEGGDEEQNISSDTNSPPRGGGDKGAYALT